MPIIVTACTNRKRYKASENLKAENLPRGILEQTIRRWADFASSCEERFFAENLYIGRPIKDSLKAAALFGSKPYILSAGMGLVEPTDKVPSYDLTITPGSSSSIQSKIVEPISPYEWWNELTEQLGTPKPLAQLVINNPDELILIACAEIYAQLVAKDLGTLAAEDLNRVRIFGPQHSQNLSKKMGTILMPYDYRFDGPDGPLRGTRTDFAQRALLHFAECVWPEIPEVSTVIEHRDKVKSKMSKMRHPEEITRKPLSDDEIIALVPAMWERANGKSSLMLRVLRDQELVACEQGRFSNLFKEAKERFSL